MNVTCPLLNHKQDLKYGILCKGGYKGKIKSWSTWIEEMETKLNFGILTICNEL